MTETPLKRIVLFFEPLTRTPVLVGCVFLLLMLGFSLRERANPWVMVHEFPGPDDPPIYVEHRSFSGLHQGVPFDADPDRDLLLFGRNDLTVELRDLSSGELVAHFGPLILPGQPGFHHRNLDLARFLPGDEFLLVVGGMVWKGTPDGVLREMPHSVGTLPSGRSVSNLSPDRRYLATERYSRLVILDLEKESILLDEDLNQRHVPLGLSWSDDGRHLLQHTREGILVFDTQLPARIHTHDVYGEVSDNRQAVIAAKMAPDGQSWIAAFQMPQATPSTLDPTFRGEAKLRRLDISTGKVLWEIRVPNLVEDLFISPDSSTLLIRNKQNLRTSHKAFDMASGVELPPPSNPASFGFPAPYRVLSPDGRFEVSSFYTFLIFDTEGRNSPIMILRDEHALYAMWLGMDRLFLMSSDSTARVLQRRWSSNFGLWVLPEVWLIHGISLFMGLALFTRLKRSVRAAPHPGVLWGVGYWFFIWFINAGNRIMDAFTKRLFTSVDSIWTQTLPYLSWLVWLLFLLMLVRVLQGRTGWHRLFIGCQSLATFAYLAAIVVVLYHQFLLHVLYNQPLGLDLHGWSVPIPFLYFFIYLCLAGLLHLGILFLLVKYRPKKCATDVLEMAV